MKTRLSFLVKIAGAMHFKEGQRRHSPGLTIFRQLAQVACSGSRECRTRGVAVTSPGILYQWTAAMEWTQLGTECAANAKRTVINL